jgi:signal transduction histidine kinase
MLPDFPYTKDNRIFLRAYAALTGVGGILITGWGAMWFATDLPGLRFGMSALVRVFGSALLATACWAAMLSQIDDPELRRKGLRWFAAGHFGILLILHLQCIAIWPPEIASKIEGVILPEFAVVLLLLIHGESYFMDDTGNPAVPITGADSPEPLRSRYERQIRQAGAQEERNRLARDIHDSIKQQIFVIQTAAATAQERFDGDHAGAALALDQIRSSAREAMTELEVMMDQLRSVPLENTGLVEALRKQCEALGHRTGARVEFRLADLPLNDALAPGAHQAILRVAQEACANIGRHARARNVTVSFGSLGDCAELRIQDDGIGFDPRSGRHGMGVANMRTRAEEFGGKFDLISSAGGGTTVTFSVPLSARMSAPYRKELIQQALLFAAMLGAVAVFTPPGRQRTFAFVAWGVAGALRIVLRTRARRRIRYGKATA